MNDKPTLHGPGSLYRDMLEAWPCWGIERDVIAMRPLDRDQVERIQDIARDFFSKGYAEVGWTPPRPRAWPEWTDDGKYIWNHDKGFRDWSRGLKVHKPCPMEELSND
jgi:hypothetical protein